MGRADSIEQFDANFVARAKDFERSAKQDAEQYRDWLEHYAATEEQDRLSHERRLKRQQAQYRRQVRYRQARRLGYRHGSALLRFLRASFVACWNVAVIFAVLLLLLAMATAKWIAVRAQILAVLLVRRLRAAVAWTKPRAYRIARALRRQGASALAFAGAQAKAGAHAASHAASVGTRTASDAATAGARAVSHAAIVSAGTASEVASAGARAASDAASVGFAWVNARAHDCARALPPMMAATRREALHCREMAGAHAFRLHDIAVVRFRALGQSVRRAVQASERTRQPGMALIAFQPASGALVPVTPACTALTLFEPAPWTGAARCGTNIVAAEPRSDPVPETKSPKRKRHAVKGRRLKPRRGPRRKLHHSPALPGKPRPRGRKRPRRG